MVIVLFEYLFIAFREPHHVAARGGRIITRQANIALVVFPYLTALLAISPSIKRKIAYLLALSIPLTVVFLHQQRSIWIALIASGIFVWVCVAIKKTRFSFKHMVVGVLTVIALLFVVNYQIGILQTLIDVQMREFIGTRMETFKELRAEPSILVRLIDLQAVFEKIKEHPIIGSGFGATVFRPLGRIYLLIVDNSFVYLYWKTGILGLAIFLWFIIAVFRKCFYVLKRCKDDETLVLVLSITAGMIGLLTVSFASVILVAYRFIIVWATMIAAAELLWLRFRARELEQG
jgi:O-antigen ligase